MELSEEQIKRFTRFMDGIEAETYPETPSEVHTVLTRQVMDHFFSRYTLPPQATILDVGCGQGVALEMFKEKAYSPVGITLNVEDVAICNRKGFQVFHMDQSFLDFEDEHFDLIWNRHCIEHSIFPLFTLHEMRRVLKPGGYIYLEMPAPDTTANHQTNPNHYSVMGKSMWLELIKRAGFKLLETFDLDFRLAVGPDKYYSFISKKPGL